MSTSFNLTANEIITQSLELLGVVAPGEPPSGDDYSSCLRSLNMMVKHWQTKGIYMTTQAEGTVFLNEGQNSYILGGSSPDKACINTNLVETQLTADAADNDTSLTVRSTSGMTIGDVIGISMDTGVTHWTTIATIPTSTTLTITSGITETATTGKYVFSYTAAIGRPLKIYSCRLRKNGGTDTTLREQVYDIRMQELSKDTYYNIVNRGAKGSPYQYFLDRQNTYSVLYVYQAPDDNENRIKITYDRIISDFSDADDIADLPQEAVKALVFNLCVDIAPKFGKGLKSREEIAPLAAMALDELQGYLQEHTPFKISPRLGY